MTNKTEPDGERRRGIAPLLVAQFFGAFNDNVWKMLVILLSSRVLVDLAPAARESAAQTRTMLAFVVFTIPLMLFSLPAGTLADRVSKRTVILWLKGVELLLLAAGTAALFVAPGGVVFLFVILGLMGLQSAIFSPAKYGILPELVPHSRLSASNGMLELWSFVAIVGGTALGPVLVERAGDAAWIAGLVVCGFSLLGLIAAARIPPVPAARSEGGMTRTIGAAVAIVRADRALFLAIVGAAWFWAIASLLGQDLIVYSQSVLELGEQWTGAPLALFAVGVGAGSALAGKLSGEKVELGLVPLGAVGLGLATLAFGAVGPGVVGTCVLMGVMGLFSGFLLVPLNALLQWRSPREHRGAVIALSNVVVFGGMLVGSLVGWGLATTALSARGIIVAAAVITLFGTAWAVWLLPEAFLRLVIFLFTHTVYRLRVLGRANVPETGGVLLAPNHMSFADGLFLIATIDRPIRFIVDEGQFNRPIVKPFLRLLRAIPIAASGGPRGILKALREAGRYLDEGEVVCIFPEGQITRTGALLPFRRGLERIAKGRDATIVPVHLDRVWGSIFSYAGGRFLTKLPERIPYPVTISFGAPMPSATSLFEVRRAVMDLAERAWQERRGDRVPLHRMFLSVVRRRPWRFLFADQARASVSRLAAFAGSIALARALRAKWMGAECVGVLLPPSVGGAMANVAASIAGKTSVNLNYTAGDANLASAVKQSGLTTVLTNRVFLERVGVTLPDSVEVIWIEDVAKGISGRERFLCALRTLFVPVRLIERACGATRPIELDDVATVVFSSGSTGEPKGVMLTHFNLDSNVLSVGQVFRPSKDDRLLGILPLFHSLGTMSLWFAINHGFGVVFHANPLDAIEIGRLVERYRVTLLLATPTFLQIYLRRCSPEQFGSLRIVMAGAEKLTDRLRDEFTETFGVRPLEGYGATECSPVIAVGVPSFRAPGFFQTLAKKGFVGPPVPGVTVRVVDPDTFVPVEPGAPGLLLVRGPNVMKGYLGRPDLTAKAIRDGYYVTGDIALVDEEGFVKITDRLARFSKIGGEMVPHGKVEEALHEAFGDSGQQRFAVTAIEDEKKGERLAVLTTVAAAEIPPVLERLARQGLPNLFIPRKDSFATVDALPVLGTGKLDLREVRRIAKERLSREPIA